MTFRISTEEVRPRYPDDMDLTKLRFPTTKSNLGYDLSRSTSSEPKTSTHRLKVTLDSKLAAVNDFGH